MELNVAGALSGPNPLPSSCLHLCHPNDDHTPWPSPLASWHCRSLQPLLSLHLFLASKTSLYMKLVTFYPPVSRSLGRHRLKHLSSSASLFHKATRRPSSTRCTA